MLVQAPSTMHGCRQLKLAILRTWQVVPTLVQFRPSSNKYMYCRHAALIMEDARRIPSPPQIYQPLCPLDTGHTGAIDLVAAVSGCDELILDSGDVICLIVSF